VIYPIRPQTGEERAQLDDPQARVLLAEASSGPRAASSVPIRPAALAVGPVRPGDEVLVESKVLAVRPSRSRPDQGLIKVRTTTLNQDGAAVHIAVGTLVAPRRLALRGKRLTPPSLRGQDARAGS
jgi:hypothetical protein